MPSQEQLASSCSKPGRMRYTLRSVINVDAFREAQMLLSAHKHLPLNFVTWPEYQALLAAINPAVEEFLTDSGSTVAADLNRAYDAHQQSVKEWLERARSLVHIAMDVWSSPQRKAYIAVHAQWVDEAYKPRKALLGLPNLRRSHAGAAMAPHLMTIIRQYNLAHRIGYFTGDNDAKNDTCLRQLAVELSQEYGLTLDPVSSRTRCAGHIINLSLQAFLFATSEDALQAAIAQAQHEANDVTVADALHDQIQSNTYHKSHDRRKKRHDTAGWRSIGPMGKLHNIAVFIRNSTVRNDAWDDIAGKALGIDNITRWNSWFKLLDAAISQEGPLSIFLNQYHNELEDDILTHDDWQQTEWASIDQVLENMDILFMQFENAKVKYASNARMVHSIHMGWWVLSKYYEESDRNPIYATALLLHPEKRRRYLDRHWAEEWRQTAIAGARQLWAKYKDRPLPSESAARLNDERREVTPYERIKQSMSVLDEPGDEDEFEKFVNSPPRPMTTKTPLEWWCREEQRIEYPRLHQLAIDILSVPAMSDDPERVFSCARRTISWDRARLSADTIEKLQCLSNWMKNDLIRKVYVAVDDEVMEVVSDDDDITSLDQMASQSSSILFQLLHSGEYSDFTLVCQEQQFYLHKAIVCPQSPVIAAALQREFQEARTKVLNVEAFDVATLRRMVNFMYTGEYEVGYMLETSCSATDHETEVSRPRVDVTEWHPPHQQTERTEVTEALLCHVRVNAIADYYNIPKLAQLANSKIQSILRDCWSAESFSHVVKEVSASTGDVALHDIITSTAAYHIEELVESQSFADLEVMSEFSIKLLRGCARRIREFEFQLQHNLFGDDSIAAYIAMGVKNNSEFLSVQLSVGFAEADKALGTAVQAAVNMGVEYVLGEMSSLAFGVQGQCMGVARRDGRTLQEDKIPRILFPRCKT
ncbi:hypothetical protein MRS44_018044 [Fusarium solani]|uniref:uncharacterized protein n=1 Tax=Fusarium solani TaxID=169388 RepID=UPI0032C3F2F5|nr:hypothetical protein MRS44_018044 [Fusarium solani]